VVTRVETPGGES